MIDFRVTIGGKTVIIRHEPKTAQKLIDLMRKRRLGDVEDRQGKGPMITVWHKGKAMEFDHPPIYICEAKLRPFSPRSTLSEEEFPLPEPPDIIRYRVMFDGHGYYTSFPE